MLSQKRMKNVVVSEPNNFVAILEVTNEENLRQLQLIQLTKGVLQLLKQMEYLIVDHIPAAVHSFYDSIMENKDLVEIINKNSSRERLEQTLARHITEWFHGIIDDEYINRRKKIAKMHVHIGLETKWYLAACHNLQNYLVKGILLKNLPKHVEVDFVEAIHKILSYEQQLVVDEYDRYALEKAIEKEAEIKQKIKETLGGIVSTLEAQSSETSASVEELIGTSKEVKESVMKGSESSLLTIATAEKGKETVRVLTNNTKEIYENTSSMSKMVDKLNQSSEEIINVVSIVKDIAIKTNLLALNSAIEAARAGEYGKGFAVVADEVRKLAVQTKNSVEQIDTLVKESHAAQQEVVGAIDVVQQLAKFGLVEGEQTDEAFMRISTMVKEVADESNMIGNEISGLTTAVEIIGEASLHILESAKLLDDTIKEI